MKRRFSLLMVLSACNWQAADSDHHPASARDSREAYAPVPDPPWNGRLVVNSGIHPPEIAMLFSFQYPANPTAFDLAVPIFAEISDPDQTVRYRIPGDTNLQWRGETISEIGLPTTVILEPSGRLLVELDDPERSVLVRVFPSTSNHRVCAEGVCGQIYEVDIQSATRCVGSGCWTEDPD